MRLADRSVAAVATWRFLAGLVAGIAAWVLLAPALAVDAYPYQALTLALSVQASVTTVLVLIAQRRGDAALHAKLDELIAASPDARDDLARLEERPREEIEAVRR